MDKSNLQRGIEAMQRAQTAAFDGDAEKAYQEAAAASQILGTVKEKTGEMPSPTLGRFQVRTDGSGTFPEMIIQREWPPAEPPTHPKYGYRVTGPHGPNKIMSWYWKGVTRDTGRGAWAFGTFWPFRGGYVSAGHVFEEMQGQVPPFAKPPVYSRAGTITDREGKKIDAAFYGVDFSGDPPPPLRVGMMIVCEAVKGSDKNLTTVRGVVEMRRPNQGRGTLSWIVRWLDGVYPKIVGESGGLISDAETGEAVAILITQGANNVDMDGDGDKDETSDVAELRPAFLAAKEASQTATA